MNFNWRYRSCVFIISNLEFHNFYCFNSVLSLRQLNYVIYCQWFQLNQTLFTRCHRSVQFKYQCTNDRFQKKSIIISFVFTIDAVIEFQCTSNRKEKTHSHWNVLVERSSISQPKYHKKGESTILYIYYEIRQQRVKLSLASLSISLFCNCDDISMSECAPWAFSLFIYDLSNRVTIFFRTRNSLI